jgi:hypothetical protein
MSDDVRMLRPAKRHFVTDVAEQCADGYEFTGDGADTYGVDERIKKGGSK